MKNLVLLIILISAITLISCKNNDYKLPYLGIHGFENNDTVYYTLPEFKFSDQNGKDFGSRELKSKPYIAYFFFTSCPSICPRMTQSAGRIQKSLEKFKNDFNIVAFSIDPDRDTASILSQYTENFGPNVGYLRLEGEKLDSFKATFGVETIFYTKNEGNLNHYQVDHSTSAFLIDPEGRIRVMFDALKDANNIAHLFVDKRTLFSK